MQIELTEPSALIKVKELAEGDYFWHNEELFFVCILSTEVKNTLNQSRDGRVLIACVHDENLSMMGIDIEVLPELRNLSMVIDKVKQE